MKLQLLYIWDQSRYSPCQFLSFTGVFPLVTHQNILFKRRMTVREGLRLSGCAIKQRYMVELAKIMIKKILIAVSVYIFSPLMYTQAVLTANQWGFLHKMTSVGSSTRLLCRFHLVNRLQNMSLDKFPSRRASQKDRFVLFMSHFQLVFDSKSVWFTKTHLYQSESPYVRTAFTSFSIYY